MTLTEEVLAFLATPRTMREVVRAFRPRGFSCRQVEDAVWNAVRRGKAENLRAGQGRKMGGLFKTVPTAGYTPVGKRPVIRTNPEFGALVEAWSTPTSGLPETPL